MKKDKKKDKKKVIGEELSDARLQELLSLSPPTDAPPTDENRAFHILIRAYRSLREDDFDRFIRFYTETSLELNPCDRFGNTLLEVLSAHHHATPYLKSLQNAQVR